MKYIKTYESFTDVDSGYEMQRIILELEKRAKYWFTKGELAKDAELVDIKQTETAVATRKSLMIEFNDNSFYYQLTIRVNIEQMDKCELILKKYDPNSDSEALELIDQLNLTGENRVDINDIKSGFILDKIAELNSKSKNPDENEIEIPKDEEPPVEGIPVGGGGGTPTPPAQGGGGAPSAQSPPAQTPSPPQGGGVQTPPAL